MSKNYSGSVKFFFSIISIFAAGCIYGQDLMVDTSQFEHQRQKINQLLADRSSRFEQYDISLEEKTGIFGLFKTNYDMQKSLNILKEVVVKDNNIFIETKKLLDLKDGEREHYQSVAEEYNKLVTAHMKTVSKLQEQNDQLKAEINTLKRDETNTNILYLILVSIITLCAYLAFKMYKMMESAKN